MMRFQRAQDNLFMARCLHLALKGAGCVSPNPLVGAVVVKNGKILSEGYHRKFGDPHAEIEVLKKLKFRANGATLYCNLEPCCHFGKTPPCVDRVIASGIKKVVISHLDPNPKVSGRSVKKLRKSGVKVKVGILNEKALFLNRFFERWIRGNLPYVIVKMAVSLDGKIAKNSPKKSPPPRGGRVRERVAWITGPQARRRVHQIRSEVDAILVGSGTVLADNPRLTVRGVAHARQPAKIILGGRRRIPRSANIFKSGGDVLMVGKKGRRVSLPPLLRTLAKKGIASVLVEGGGEIFRSFQGTGLVDEMILHVSPKVLGEREPSLDRTGDSAGMSSLLRLESISPIGPDTEYHFFTRKKR